MTMVNEKHVWLNVDKSTPNWTYTLRVRVPGVGSATQGAQLATFNPYTLAQVGGISIAQKIADLLDAEMKKREEALKGERG